MLSVSITGYLALGLQYSAGTFTEVAGGGYARTPLTLTTLDGASLGNAAGVTFGPDNGTSWGPVTWIGLFDAPSAGNLLLVWPQNVAPRATATGTVTIASRAIQLLAPRLLAALADSGSTGFASGSLVGETAGPVSGALMCGAVLSVGSGRLQAATAPAGALQASANFSDVANPTLARVNINQGDTALAFGSVINTNCSTGNVFNVTLTGNAELGPCSNLRAGASYIWRLIQDASGGRALTFDPSFKFPSGTAPSLTATANATDILSAISDGSNVYATLMKDMR